MASSRVEFMQKLDDEFCTCPICFEAFEEPKQLACSHVYCSPCIQSFIKNAKKMSMKKIRCPICRHEQNIPSRGLHGLKNARMVKNLIEFRKNHAVEPEEPAVADIQEDKLLDAHLAKCSSCDQKLRECYYCLDCDSRDMLCKSCSTKHKDRIPKHHVLDVSNAPVSTRKKLLSITYSANDNKTKFMCCICSDLKADWLCLSIGFAVCSVCKMSIDAIQNYPGIPCNKLSKQTVKLFLQDSLSFRAEKKGDPLFSGTDFCQFCTGKGREQVKCTWFCMDCRMATCESCLTTKHTSSKKTFCKTTISGFYGQTVSSQSWKEKCTYCSKLGNVRMRLCLTANSYYNCGKVACHDCTSKHRRYCQTDWGHEEDIDPIEALMNSVLESRDPRDAQAFVNRLLSDSSSNTNVWDNLATNNVGKNVKKGNTERRPLLKEKRSRVDTSEKGLLYFVMLCCALFMTIYFTLSFIL